MPTTTRRLPHLFLLLALVLTLVGAAPLDASAKPDNGPGAVTTQCSQGAWASRARSESPSTPFASQQDCTKYLTQGGVAVALQITTDADGDGVSDTSDRCPGSNDAADMDGDGLPVGCDGTDNRDADGDGVQNYLDVCAAGDDTVDLDGDGIPDACDAVDDRDTDGDGVPDTADVCQGDDDAADRDGDGTPDGCDNDADNDGLTDDEEATLGTDPLDSDSDDDDLSTGGLTTGTWQLLFTVKREPDGLWRDVRREVGALHAGHE